MSSESTKPRVNPVVAQAAAYVKRNTWKRTKNPRQLTLFTTLPVRKSR